MNRIGISNRNIKYDLVVVKDEESSEEMRVAPHDRMRCKRIVM
jgi:hypothetical protein